MVQKWGIRKVRAALLFITIMAVLAGCSSGTAGKDSEAASAAGGTQVKKIIVGTGTQFPNVCFIDDKGNLTGYDVELIREIDKRLPEYEFEFSTMDFKNLLLSLETKKIDLIAHQMEVNEERQAKFLFNDEAYNIFPNKVVVSEKNDTVHSIDDLKGKKLIVGATSNAAVLAEKWNAAHGNAIDIVYSGAGEDTITQIKTGRVDATISTPFAIDYQNKAVDAQLKTVGDALSNSKVYFILNKDEQELKTKIDEALKSIKKDGTLAKLSTEWLGADYTVEE
ncbi:transporter substrate-binding domain-containing protein [Paenibacillus barcinonensis]|uniref:L-cystine transport system substrate-binding protein n=1 Tax=Paenibacillus barcinonensis TaxID=198119 RepID=A0A2V4V7A4_PAEBA|nr:transporter substrate-binding domain-containing protein [Paenibacillus barcinonensis]PYE48295.1 L-cystine transport system substrate-binding protein [Paenibacillus barcinonensis]QKS56862.1 transporter substrate-binding domain-containing protein [Paenibacillus barcinonensis]